MDDEIVCPRCGTDEHLRGERDGDVVHTTCDACELSWDRDLRPRCKTCGSEDVRGVPKPIVQKARGSQLSIIASTVVYLCPRCDADVWEQQRSSGSGLTPDENPADGVR